MTNLVVTESGTEIKDLNTLDAHTDSDVRYPATSLPRHVLKSKEKTYKHNCEIFLKRKLRKYKLRQDGTEDQDVIDVSKILMSSLVIKSSSNESEPYGEEGDINNFQVLRPKNYLFKMVRKRESIKICNSDKSAGENIKLNETVDIPDAVINDEKKHTNAFQLLMDSRNKSIGANSPGKDQNHDYSDTEDLLEKKSTKSKRQLLLQKMAESKGYYKNKEMEEYQDKVIKIKMEKRAKRLKSMIMKEPKLNEKKHLSNPENKEDNSSKLEKTINLKNIKDSAINKQSKRFRIIDIFNTLNDPVSEEPHRKHILKEDKEFLKKLSPSVKKTESVLSYFRKVEKEPESCSVDVENDNHNRVKLKPKSKKKGQRKKLSLKKNVLNECGSLEINNENKDIKNCNLNKEEVEPSSNSETKSIGKRQKRKRSTKINEIHNSKITALSDVTESRPKRSIKKPVKYTEKICLSSSDEDLYIFTPKKKKHLEVTSDNRVIAKHDQNEIVCKPVKAKSSNSLRKVKENTSKKPLKLAPIFATKHIDPAALEAKQKFLQSGVPDKLKKIINQQNNNSKVGSNFTKVIHVQQIDSAIEQIKPPLLNVLEYDLDDVCFFTNEDTFKKLLNLSETCHSESPHKYRSVSTILQSIKELHPKFPVYRTYRCLKSKWNGEFKDCNLDFNNSVEIINDVVDVTNDNLDIMNWTDKYKAMSTSEIIGNFESIRELRKWLVSWTENELKSKKKDNNESDSSDFYNSDTDSRDSLNTMNNLLVITGPTGCGKTSSIYAVAAELSIKVIEVNVSSKRTGKIMLQDLQEATQSHKVNRLKSTDNSQKSQEKNLTEQLKKNRKRGRPKKSLEKQSEQKEIKHSNSTLLSQENTRTDMSLILIDDADIVFDQDDGFSSAIVQLVQCSKRPVILITSSLMSPHLQRFLQNGKILKMCPLLPQLLGTWLDIMCLADNGISWPGVGAKFLDYFRGDIRKTINFLQFYVASYIGMNSDEQTASQNIDSKRNVDDENSGMSWAEREDIDWRKIEVHNNLNMEMKTMWTEFVKKNLDLTKYKFPINLFNIWWNIPNLLAFIPVIDAETTVDNKTCNNGNKMQEFESITDVIEAISLSDVIGGVCSYTSSDITAQPWHSFVSDSMSEQVNIDYYMNKYELGDEISHAIVTGAIASAQDVLKCQRNYNISSPGMSIHRKRDKLISRHKNLTSFINPSVMLDRRSLTLDYWSSCRTICRIEKSRNDANLTTKRHNRFSHYLKSLSALCKSDTFDSLCDSLSDRGTDLNIINYN